MKFSLCTIFLGITATGAFLPASQTSRSVASLNLSSSTETPSNVFAKPEKVVLDELPTLYVYDHCPFCVRVRVALGVKNIKHNLHFMANDDKILPTELVGKKIAPIFVSSFVLKKVKDFSTRIYCPTHLSIFF
jgi:hypothetical protein